MGHATIKDIARKLQLSTSTVSRALRDRYDVNPETRKRVMQMAEVLNYMPSSQALGLLKRKTLTIGVVVPEIDNQFFSQAIHGIENVAFDQDYHILICQTRDDVTREARIIEKLLSSRVDGIIVSLCSTVTDVTHLKRVMKYEVPLVLFDRVSEEIDTHKVLNDDYDGAYRATQHLLSKGYRRIAHLAGPSNLAIARERRRGYEAALREAGIEPKPEWIVEGSFKQETGRKHAIPLLLSRSCDALFCVSDHVAIGALMAARDMGLRIPEEVAIMGFSNLAVTEILEPALSTVAQPAYEMGREAARMLLDIISHPERSFSPQTKMLPTEVVARKST